MNEQQRKEQQRWRANTPQERQGEIAGQDPYRGQEVTRRGDSNAGAGYGGQKVGMQRTGQRGEGSGKHR